MHMSVQNRQQWAFDDLCSHDYQTKSVTLYIATTTSEHPRIWMLSLDCLEALDYVIWLGAETQAAAMAACNQSTISRRARQAVSTFDIQLIKADNAWNTLPASNLLTLERQVHQLFRFSRHRRLRLDSDHWAGRQLVQTLPTAWIHRGRGCIGIERPMHLLRERIIDAWMTCTKPDLPASDDPTYQVIELASMPLAIACAPGHPLTHAKALSVGDLQQFPSLGVASHHYPQFAQAMQAHGVWNAPQAMRTYSYEQWEGRALQERFTIPINPLSTAADSPLIPLDFSLSIDDCIAVVIRRDTSEQPAIHELLQHLQQQIHTLSLEHPQLTALT